MTGQGDDGATGRVFTAAEWRLRALSPLDGRYGRQMEPYAAAFCEAALVRERFAVEVAWLVHLSGWPGLDELGPCRRPISPLSSAGPPTSPKPTPPLSSRSRPGPTMT